MIRALALSLLLAGCGPGSTKKQEDMQILLCIFPCLYLNRGGNVERVTLPHPPQELPRNPNPQPPDDTPVRTPPESPAA